MAFNPNQPRDKNGMWTGQGGGTPSRSQATALASAYLSNKGWGVGGAGSGGTMATNPGGLSWNQSVDGLRSASRHFAKLTSIRAQHSEGTTRKALTSEHGSAAVTQALDSIPRAYKTAKSAGARNSARIKRMRDSYRRNRSSND